MEYTEAFRFVHALMAEAKIDLNKSFIPCHNEFDEAEWDDEPDLQYTTSEALAEAFLVFFEGLSKSVQAELRTAMKRFEVAPTEKDLEKWRKK